LYLPGGGGVGGFFGRGAGFGFGNFFGAGVGILGVTWEPCSLVVIGIGFGLQYQ
jgi:hypothetical protein